MKKKKNELQLVFEAVYYNFFYDCVSLKQISVFDFPSEKCLLLSSNMSWPKKRYSGNQRWIFPTYVENFLFNAVSTIETLIFVKLL